MATESVLDALGRGRQVCILAVLLAGCHRQPLPTGEHTSAPAEARPVPAASGPVIPVSSTLLEVIPPHERWELGRVSWVAQDRNGLIYLLQRGDRADPVVVINRDGRVVPSWGKGMYTMPHSIRIDRGGNVWTTDAATSVVTKFSPQGKQLMTLHVGGQPLDCTNRFCGTTDVAFGPKGEVYIADGYANARILEYTADGRKVREWGKKGSGPGEFNLPHSIVIDEAGIVYVADRENRRVQRFDLRGRSLGTWPTNGSPYSLAISAGIIWISVLPPPEASALKRILVKADRQSGTHIGEIEVTQVHGFAMASAGGQILVPAVRGLHILEMRR